jgi:carbamoyl-phosphate synthase large subunit
MHIVRTVEPQGIIVQFGGQTPLNLANGLHEQGAPLIGTSVESIDRAEDREHFSKFLRKLGLRQPDNGIARSPAEAFEVARRIGYPVIVRPSFVLGGRAMEIVYDDAALDRYMTLAVQASPERPVLVDRFLEDAIEVDVDCIADGKNVVIAGIMEHIEEAGIHSGDSVCVLPPHTLDPDIVAEIARQTKGMALELQVVGLMNVQFAVKGELVYVLEVNPRASRTVPFVSKATGVPFAKLAAKVMCGMTLPELGCTEEIVPPYFSVKAPVFPHNRFPNADPTLGPEMRSTGEVMGLDPDLGAAFLKAYLAAGIKLPKHGRILLTVKSSDKRAIVGEARALAGLGYELLATDGTYRAIKANGIPCERVNKVGEGRPHIVDLIKNREIALVLNTPYGKKERKDDSAIRAAAVHAHVPCITTLAGIQAIVSALTSLHKSPLVVRSLQSYHERLRAETKRTASVRV